MLTDLSIKLFVFELVMNFCLRLVSIAATLSTIIFSLVAIPEVPAQYAVWSFSKGFEVSCPAMKVTKKSTSEHSLELIAGVT